MQWDIITPSPIFLESGFIVTPNASKKRNLFNPHQQVQFANEFASNETLRPYSAQNHILNHILLFEKSSAWKIRGSVETEYVTPDLHAEPVDCR